MAGPKLVEKWRRGSVASKSSQPQVPAESKRSKSTAVAGYDRPSIARSGSSVQDRLVTSLRFGKSRSASVDTGSESASNSLANHFFGLPNELHALILLELQLNDILTLRVVSRSFCDLVTSCQTAIVRHYSKTYLSQLQRDLYPPPAPGQAELRYVLDMCHRQSSADKLATILCDFVSQEILRRNTARKRRKFAPTWSRMRERMRPLLLTLTHFFENYRDIILERSLASSQPGSSYHIYSGTAQWEDQLQIMEKYNPALLLDCYRMYGFMLQAFERQLRPPSYATAFERVVRGWTAKPASSHEIGTLLMLGGVDQVQRVLSHKTYNDRRKALDMFLKGLSPSETTRWKDNWTALGGISPSIALERIPTTRIGVPPLHLIWVPNALKMLLAKEVIDDVEFGVNTSANSTRYFISELVGYDILRQSAPPAAEGGEDDEDEDGDEQNNLDSSSEGSADEDD